jgi:hypothetical protein
MMLVSNSLAVQADWAKFAEMAGFKNAHSASVSFSSVKRKVLGTADAGSSKPAAKKPIPKKPTPSKRKQAPALFEPVHTDDEDSQESPLKKLKPTPKKGLKKKQESDDEGGPAYL